MMKAIREKKYNNHRHLDISFDGNIAEYGYEHDDDEGDIGAAHNENVCHPGSEKIIFETFKEKICVPDGGSEYDGCDIGREGSIERFDRCIFDMIKHPGCSRFHNLY
jgi:hypothetical protein